MPTIDLSDGRLWNPAYLSFLARPKTYNVLFGGAGSGKSGTMHRYFIMQLLATPGFRLVVLRKTGKSIRASVWQEFKDICVDWGVDHLFTFRKSTFEVECANGSRVVMMGVDDPEKLKSLATFDNAWLEEATEFTLEDFTQVTLRLRGRSDTPKRFWITFNPISEGHWLKKRFFDNPPEPESIQIIRTTYRDNQFLDEAFIKRLNSLSEVGGYYFDVYALGEWGQLDPDSLFAFKFNHADMVYTGAYVDYFEDFTIYISFDFNVMNTATVYQIDDTEADGKQGTVYVLETIRINDLETLCRQLVAKYGNEDILITGDASGFSRSAYTQGNVNAYQQIKAFMELGDAQIKTPAANPSHLNSRFLCNSALVKYDWVFIEGRNQELIVDLKSAKVDNRMSLDPWKKDNPKIGHALDTWRYFCHTFLRAANRLK